MDRMYLINGVLPISLKVLLCMGFSFFGFIVGLVWSGLLLGYILWFRSQQRAHFCKSL